MSLTSHVCAARSTSTSISTHPQIQLKETYTPGVTLDLMIRQDPAWSHWEVIFNDVAKQLMARVRACGGGARARACMHACMQVGRWVGGYLCTGQARS